MSQFMIRGYNVHNKLSQSIVKYSLSTSQNNNAINSIISNNSKQWAQTQNGKYLITNQNNRQLKTNNSYFHELSKRIHSGSAAAQKSTDTKMINHAYGTNPRNTKVLNNNSTPSKTCGIL